MEKKQPVENWHIPLKIDGLKIKLPLKMVPFQGDMLIFGGGREVARHFFSPIWKIMLPVN